MEVPYHISTLSRELCIIIKATAHLLLYGCIKLLCQFWLCQVFSLPWIASIIAPKHGLLVELDENGQITRSFHDPMASVIPSISEVHDDGDVLYFGSFNSPFVGKLVLKDWSSWCEGYAALSHSNGERLTSVDCAQPVIVIDSTFNS